MDFVLVRHGVHDSSGRLTLRGEYQVLGLADALKDRGSIPDLILHSSQLDAARTALMLSAVLAPSARLVEIPALTPRCGPGDLSKLADQARRQDADPALNTCVLAVGHEGRLSNLIIELTGRRSYPVPHGGAVCVRASGMLELLAGRGLVQYRFPTVDYQEDQLRSKVNSKMTIAALLAGFVLTGLSALLVLQGRPHFWGSLALITFSMSLALFLASVYFYDQLSTPSGFWTDAAPPRLPWKRLYERREARIEALWQREFDKARCEDGCEGDEARDKCRAQRADDHPAIYRALHDGHVYWLMVNTSRRVFTPAVLLAVTGFSALLIGTGNPWIWVGGLAGLAAAGLYAAVHRPELGAD